MFWQRARECPLDRSVGLRVFQEHFFRFWLFYQKSMTE